ncbi:MAG: acetate kinase [Gemmatimonadaceae bacterium]
MAVDRVNILALNAGSSSLKASLFELDGREANASAPTGLRWEAESVDGLGVLERLITDLWTGADSLLTGPQEIDVIGHRVVHGGPTLLESTRVTPAVRAAIAGVAEYAPAHNAAAIGLMEATARIFGDRSRQVAVFDTAFHRTLPPAAFTYAGPYAWLEAGLRRFGFHGVSHQYSARRAALLTGDRQQGIRVVTCHLGSGCSLAAVRDGRSVDTTMGFTPLDGVPMARRSGAIDPGLLLHLLRHGGETPNSLDYLLNNDAGLAGLSGTSGDMRAVLAAIDAHDERARLALDVFVHRTRQGIAAMAASMGGVDALVFTGGIGEHAPRVRAEICAMLHFLGVTVDPARNAASAGESDISGEDAAVRVFVIPAQENWMVACECVRVAGSPLRPEARRAS